MKAGFTPVTQRDMGRAEAARSLENQGYSEAQHVLKVQLMSQRAWRCRG